MNGTEKRTGTTAVAILSSNYLLRLGLQRIVENEKWIRLIGHAANAVALDALLTREQPHIIVIDTEIAPDVTGLIQKIKLTGPIRVILLSGLQDSECTRQAIDFGVDSIVLKVQPSAVLIATIQYLSQIAEEAVLQTAEETTHQKSIQVSNVIVEPASTACPTRWPDGLTEREREVVQLISQGLSNKDIADRLCISSITVRHHLTSIFDKLGVSNRQKLLLRAQQYGLVGSRALA